MKKKQDKKRKLVGSLKEMTLSFQTRGLNGKDKTSTHAFRPRNCWPQWHNLCCVAETPAQSCSTKRAHLRSISVLLLSGKMG